MVDRTARLPRRFCGVEDCFLDALEGGGEVEGAAFFEGEADLYEVVVGWDAAAGGGGEDAFPDVGTEEGGCDVGVVEGEEGGLEGLEGWCWVCGEVDQLVDVSV